MDEPSPGTLTATEVAQAHLVAREVFDVVGTKWAVQVIEAIGTETRRFGELHRRIAGISHRLLTATLRQLERNGVVDRTFHATTPPRTEYRLTHAGRELHDTINGFCRWSRRHLHEILASRHRFEQS